MFKKKQVLTLVSIAVISFLIGTTFSITTSAMDRGNPFDKIWEVIYDLQGRVENLEESINGVDIERFVNEISRVELISVEPYGAIYFYYYGVSGHWNVTMLQTEPFTEKLNSTIGGALRFFETYYVSISNTWYKGYERGLKVCSNKELNPTEIEEVRLLIKEYLAHL